LSGICWDSAMAESFFAALKTEFDYRRIWPTKASTVARVLARPERLHPPTQRRLIDAKITGHRTASVDQTG